LLESPLEHYLVNDDLHYKPLIALFYLATEDEENIEFGKRYVELTPFGRDFIKTVIE
jgi:hypothetical protein